MASNHSAEKRKRKSPYKTHFPKRNAHLTPEQQREHDARLEAERARIEREMIARLQ